MRVAIVGTFDVENFGDLLFPLLAREQLRSRVDGVEVVPYSYRAMSEHAWPYAVRPLERLEHEIADTDLLLVGGGALIRFDTGVAPGYGPTAPDVHHPTGLWLGPTLTAICAGVPVAWNAVGVFGSVPESLSDLVRAVVSDCALVAVRDPASAALLAEAGATGVRLAPDTAFASVNLVPERPSEAWRAALDRVGSRDRYVLLQPSPQLGSERARVRELVDAALAAGLDVVELPISPALGDRPGCVELDGRPTRAVEGWPDPVTIAELACRSEGVIAQSLHLSIVAATAGVPVHRPAWRDDDKYALLEGIDAVRPWSTAGAPAVTRFGRLDPGSRVRELRGETASHWDELARICAEGVPKRGTRTAAAVARSLEEAADALVTATVELQRERSTRAASEFGERAATARLAELERRRSVRAALAVARAWRRLSERPGPGR